MKKMSIEKKSLISTLKTTKKANVASTHASDVKISGKSVAPRPAVNLRPAAALKPAVNLRPAAALKPAVSLKKVGALRPAVSLKKAAHAKMIV